MSRNIGVFERATLLKAQSCAMMGDSDERGRRAVV